MKFPIHWKSTLEISKVMPVSKGGLHFDGSSTVGLLHGSKEAGITFYLHHLYEMFGGGGITALVCNGRYLQRPRPAGRGHIQITPQGNPSAPVLPGRSSKYYA